MIRLLQRLAYPRQLTIDKRRQTTVRRPCARRWSVVGRRLSGIGAARIAVWFALLLAACGGGARGDAERGAALFRVAPAGGGLACAECHSLAPGDDGLLGPSLAGIAGRAGATVPDQPAASYLRVSILDPDAHLAAGFQEGMMPRGYGEALADDQVADLVAYMLTLR